jgi:hypothetical protein
MDMAPARVTPHRLVLKWAFIVIYRFNTTPSADFCQMVVEYGIRLPGPRQSGKRTFWPGMQLQDW